MITLLVSALVILLVAWLITVIVAQVPGVPGFVPTVIWAIAVICILVLVLRWSGVAIAR